MQSIKKETWTKYKFTSAQIFYLPKVIILHIICINLGIIEMVRLTVDGASSWMNVFLSIQFDEHSKDSGIGKYYSWLSKIYKVKENCQKSDRITKKYDGKG